MKTLHEYRLIIALLLKGQKIYIAHVKHRLSFHCSEQSLDFSRPNFIWFGCIHEHLRSYFLLALAGVAQWIEHGPANQRVTGSIPSEGTCLGFRPGPQ